MRSPFRSFTRFTTSTVLSLLAIITILLGYKFLSTQYEKLEALEHELPVLQAVKGDLEQVRDKMEKDIPLRIPKSNTPLNILGDRIKALEVEIAKSEADIKSLKDKHPFESRVLTSNTFRQIATKEIEIRFLQQELEHVRKIHTFATCAAGKVDIERRFAQLEGRRSELEGQIFQNQKAQWQLSKQAPWTWQIPYTDAYDQMRKLEAGERELKDVKKRVDDDIAQLKRMLDPKACPNVGQLRLDQHPANEIIRPVITRLNENEDQLKGSNFRNFMRPVREVLPTALWLLGLALLSPLLVKAIAYYLIAPVAVRRPPVRLLPASSGKLSTSIGGTSNESGQTMPSRVSLPLTLDEHSELLVLPSYLQGMPLNAKSDTRWLLDWSMPLTSLLAGMYRLTRIRPNSEERITVSSSIDPLTEFSLLDVPAGSALVLQPSCLVGVIQTRGEQLKITRHWRFGNLASWLTLQFRYIVFHGPAKLIVKGCRGVRVEPAISGRTVNQAATLGFSANLDYSVARNETFWSYYFGERELFNDSWAGDGCCVHAETPNPGDHSGLFGRGLQGIVDTFLKIFGI